MKKLFLFFAILLCSSFSKALAYEFSAENEDGVTIYYMTGNFTEAYVTYDKYHQQNYSGNVVIPATVTHNGKTYPVTAINRDAFYGCSRLESVTFGSNIVRVYTSAFTKCTGLTSITIPANVKNIYDHCFEGCAGLTSITIPDNVEYIGDSCFADCYNLASITIPDNIMQLGNGAFDGTPWYDSQPEGIVYIGNIAYRYKGTLAPHSDIVIKEGTVGIASKAFSKLNYKSVTIPKSLRFVGADAFYWNQYGLDITVHVSDLAAWCNITFSNNSANPLAQSAHLIVNGTEIKDLVIPDNVTQIKQNAFYMCRDFTSVTIPSSVTRICENAFYYCDGIKSLTLSEGLEDIERNAFYSCRGLTSLTIPNTVTRLPWSVFGGCTGLESVKIGSGVASIEHYTFSGCTSLKSIDIPDGVRNILSRAFYGCASLSSVTIGKGLSNIAPDAFASCDKLTSIAVDPDNSVFDSRDDSNCLIRTATNTLVFGNRHTVIPNSVEIIGDSAFQHCNGLTSVIIPEGVTKIGFAAFAGCFDLTSVIISEGVTEIGATAFSFCTSLTSITFPSSLTTFGAGAFSLTYPKTVICKWTNPPVIRKTLFDDSTYQNASLHIPSGSTDAYKATNYWYLFKNMKDDANGVDNVLGTDFLVQSQDGKISVSGATDGQKLSIYNTAGVELGNATIHNGTATIDTQLQPGSIAIIKMGERSVKCTVK